MLTAVGVLVILLCRTQGRDLTRQLFSATQGGVEEGL